MQATPAVTGLRLLSSVFNASVLAIVLCVSGCGFHLRGETVFPFSTLYLSGPANSPVLNDLRRIIASGGKVNVVDKPEAAEMKLEILGDAREKVILSLSAAGKVREFQLRHRVTFNLRDPKGPQVAGAPGEILINRVVSFNDAQILAKESEENLLYRDMQADAVRQLLQRLSAAKS
jgi:LPS-assembly lipoprotein